MADKGALFLSPDGHGGTVAALAASGAIEHMRHRGIRHLFYLQVDNPLVPICDAELIGYHLLAQSDLTSMAVAKQSPQDKLGNFVMIDGRVQVIEYSDFPDDVSARRAADGSLCLQRSFWKRHLRAATPFHSILLTRRCRTWTTPGGSWSPCCQMR
jgi:UDP-N-acetylglucosamine/UDP-N-acetylgalactosamine diphosphorylase